MSRLPRVLICDDDLTFHLALKHGFGKRFDFRSAMNGDEALVILKSESFDILVLDLQMRTPDEGLVYLPRLLEADGDLSVMMSSGVSDFQYVREAMRAGAVDYLRKDFDPEELLNALNRVLERRRLIANRERQARETVRTDGRHLLLGESTPMKALRRTIERLRGSAANVLITGEMGTGKEAVARHLRGVSPDGSPAPFIAVDSSTIQSSTAESLLFGHEKGAFTGADKSTKGIFEEADGGAAYFDEIANMPMDIQAKLLRVLQEKEVQRMGSHRVIRLDFRVISASNRDLDAMVARGEFKPDLLERLNVLPLHLPPLRERAEDIPDLLAHFARIHAGGRPPLRFSAEAIGVLGQYAWPGNVRELGNLVAYLTAMCDSPEVEPSDLPPKLRTRKETVSTASEATPSDFYARVASFETSILKDAYEAHEGNVSKMAMILNMDRSHLHSKLKEYGIHSAKRPKA